jgi:hypothetical protein
MGQADYLAGKTPDDKTKISLDDMKKAPGELAFYDN